MDVHSLETMLDSFDTIPDLVFNFLQDADPSVDQTLTLVVSKCFTVLLRCLGHRFWSHCVHSPKEVLDVVMQHCRLGSWRAFVTKQFIEVFPPLLVAMRPPQVSIQTSNNEKLDFYLKSRREILRFLVVEDLRPKHFDTVAIVALSRATFTILSDCYAHRIPGVLNTQRVNGRDEGALPQSISIDYSVAESAFWWPCGTGAVINSDTQLGKLWMDHLFNIVIRPNNVESLVDLAAETTALILSKHLQLARDVVYSSIVALNGGDSACVEAVTKGPPIITDLLHKLCLWDVVTTIPLQVHGALFESIGGISELLNCIKEQTISAPRLQPVTEVLLEYEAQTQHYLQRMSEEVLCKGLANPFSFPVVSQHISACYLSPTSSVDQHIKRLIGNYAADKKRPTQVPSSLEAFLISVHRNPEAFLRGQLSMLQSMRLYGFSHAVCLPAVKKLILVWSRAFDMLGGELQKVFQKASSANALSSSSHQVTDTGIAATHLLKLPSLINDFLIALLTALFDPNQKLTLDISEATRVRCLDFGLSFWKFWASMLKDPCVSSKRVTGLISPLVECIARGSMSENVRAAELLMLVLECLLKGNTRIDETILTMIDSIKGEAAAIESKHSTDFGRLTKKFRQLEHTSSFFAKRAADPNSVKEVVNLTSRSKLKLAPQRKTTASMLKSTSRPMSGKSAARAQSKALVDLSGFEEVSNEAAGKKQHLFYSEEEYRLPFKREPAVTKQLSRTKTSFDMARVINEISHSHPALNKVDQTKRPRQVASGEASAPVEKENGTDTDLQFAALFYRIKTMRKAIAVCSLLPFYRQLLQTGMPVLLSGEFQTERSNKEFQVPSLSFKKSADYVRAFLPLLVEECVNEVQEGLRKCLHGNGGHLLRYESEKPREGMRCISFSVIQRDEGVVASSQSKFGRPRKNNNEKLFRNGDVVYLQVAVGNQNKSDFIGKREFLGVIMITEMEKGRRQTSSTKKGLKNEEEEAVSVLFLNDGELDSATATIRSFSTDLLAASAIAELEWKVTTLCNLITYAREYVALRSVDMLPEHLRSAILTPEAFKSAQSELLAITSVLDELRGDKSRESCAKVVTCLKRLDAMDVRLTDLRSTSIGKAVNKLRKHDDPEIKALSATLKEKWTNLIDEKDALTQPPRFLSSELWEAIKLQYNSSQLQSIHSVLNNYSVGVSLLQGPPGTGKTKTIMGLLSGLLSLRLPATTAMPIVISKSSHTAQSSVPKGEFTNFDAARSRQVKVEQSDGHIPSSRTATTTFSLQGVSSALGSILRRSSDSSSNGPSRTSIQALKSAASSRDRLESKLASRTQQSSSNLVARRRIISRAATEHAASRTNNILLCAPSNGAVNELVLRIVTDGLMDSLGKVTKIRAPSLHPEACLEDYISIVRLGNAGEDASESVNSVCLPHIIRREMVIHPKAMALQTLQDIQRQMRSEIRDFHIQAEGKNRQKKDRKALAKLHQQLTECSGKIRRLRDEVTAIRAKMTETILSKASIIACTLSKAGSSDLSELKHGFDALIIDEAAQAVELSTLVPIRERVARVILVGDPKQLPATVKSVVAAKARYDRSLFERIAESGVAPSMLRVQYRMHPFLREFPSKTFYGGMLTDGPSVMERVQKICSGIYAHASFQPFLVYDLENSKEEDMDGSKYNRMEAAFCIGLCQHMVESCADVRKNKWSIGFVSPYKEQVRVLRQEITRSRIPASVAIEVNTVDGFQGREKDVIVFSCVRSSKRGGIGFLRDIRRLNVAITRARFCLYVVGNVNTLVRDETWAALVKSARDRKLIIETKGEPFSAVAKRLEGDRYRDLSEHFKLMHEKVGRKAALSTKPIKLNMTKPKEQDRTTIEGIHEVNEAANCAAANKAGLQDEDKKPFEIKKNESIKEFVTSDSSLELLRDLKGSNQALDHPTESHKRPATTSSHLDVSKKPRLPDSSAPTKTNMGQNGISRDRSSSLTMSSNSHKEATDQCEFRSGGHSVEKTHCDKPLFRRSVDKSRSSAELSHSSTSTSIVHRDRIGDGTYQSKNQYHETDRRGNTNQSRHLIGEERRTSRAPFVPPTSQAMSKKEFSRRIEPSPFSKADRMHSTAPRSNGKRPHPESSHLPLHSNRRDRASSSKSSYRSRTNESSQQTRHTRAPTRRSSDVLNNILGSAKKLASSTSRVHDNAHSRSSEFS